MKLLLYTFLLLTGILAQAATKVGTTITCANATETEVWVNAIDALAVDGDTVVIPDNLPTGGTFTLTYSGQTTTALNHNASAATVDAALEALSNIGAGDVTVTQNTGPYQYRVEFTNALALTDVALISATDSLTPTTGRDMAVAEIWKGAPSGVSIGNEKQSIRMGTNWVSQHVLAKAIKLQGAGRDNTIILNSYETEAFWIRFDLVVNKVTEITGIAFKNGSAGEAGNIDSNGVLRFIGVNPSTPQLRVHDCRFEELRQWPIFLTQVKGVFDHNEWINTNGGGGYIYGLNWKSDPPSGSPAFGDGSWAYPTNAGSEDAIYFENNLFNQTGSVWDNTFFDGTRGGRAVARYNTFIKPLNKTGDNASLLTCHGLEGRNRSIRHFEFYNNYVVDKPGTSLVHQRGGTMIVYNNRVKATALGATEMGFQLDRESDPGPWGRCSGSNPYDVNDTNGSGDNDDPTPFFSGQMGGPDTGLDFIRVVPTPSPAWTDDQWIGFSVSDTTRTFADAVGDSWRGETAYMGGPIIDSGPNWLITQGCTFCAAGNAHNYVSGDNFVIYKSLSCMDQIGRAGTSSASLLTGGGTDVNPPVFPPGWNNQVTEPLYEWNNIKGTATDIDFASDAHPQIRLDVHYKNDAVKPGYPWTAGVATICGAEDYENVPLTGSESLGGKGGFTYPHPLTTVASDTTRTCADLSYEEVNNAVNGVVTTGHTTWDTPAPHGTTVVLPAGTALWTSTLTINNRIKLIGQTVVTGDHNSINPDPDNRQTTMTATDNTIIQEGITVGRGQPGTSIIKVDIQTGPELTRISGITFAPDPLGARTVTDAVFNSTTTVTSDNANFTARDVSNSITGTGIPNGTTIASVTNESTIVLNKATTTSGTAKTITYEQSSLLTDGAIRFLGHGQEPTYIRVDHCHFNYPNWGKSLRIAGWTYGVVDHNINHSNGAMFAIIWTDELLTQAMKDMGITTIGHGHGSWAEYPKFGSGDFIFFEDNAFVGPQTSGGAGTGNFDSKDGARWVTRFNQWYGSKPNSHGTGGGPQRGVRAFMQYGDTIFYSVPSWAGGELRSGSAIAHDNTLYGTRPTNDSYPMRLQPDRPYGGQAGPEFPPMAGQTVWDQNAGLDGVTPIVEADGSSKAGHLFAEGLTNVGVPLGAGVFTITMKVNPNWTPVDKWKDYGILNSTYLIGDNSPQYRSGIITASTANTITYQTYGALDNPQLTFRDNDNAQIRKPLRGMDEPGTGKGDIVTGGTISQGDPPLNRAFPSPRPAWPRNQEERIFTWNNTHVPSGAPMDMSETAFPTIPLTAVDNMGNDDGYTPFTIPSPVSTYYNAAKNGPSFGAYTQDYTYPHPLIGGATGKLINVPTNHPFGSVTIGQSVVYNIPVTNDGDTITTVSNVTFPTGYTVAGPLTFPVPAHGTVTKAVTFSPVAAIPYNGSITFVNDGTGNNVMTVTGTGVPGAPGDFKIIMGAVIGRRD